MKKASTCLCILAIGIAITTVFAAWLIQSFAPGQIRFWIVSVWVGRALGIAVVATCIASLIAVYSESSKLTRRRKVLISILVPAVIILSYFVLDFKVKAPAGEVHGRYIFSADWTTRHTEHWKRVLAHLKDKPNVHALEIGSFEGRSAIWFLENILTDPSATITCIDIFNAKYEMNFDHNTRYFGAKVKKIRAPSQLALRRLEPSSYDFAYIDGSHVSKDTLIDAVLTWDLMKPGGIIIIDDYFWENGKEDLNNDAFTPQLGINAFLQVFEPYLDFIEKDSQIIVRKRPNINKNSPQMVPKTSSKSPSFP